MLEPLLGEDCWALARASLRALLVLRREPVLLVCPVLLLGIWWRGLTDAGAIAGMVTGGLLCGGAMVAGAALGSGTPVWLAQPAAWTVPAAFAVMVLTSRATKSRIPRTITKVMTRLHTPERPLATGR